MEESLSERKCSFFDAYNMDEYDIMNLPQEVHCQNIETLNILIEKVVYVGLSHKVNYESLTLKF